MVKAELKTADPNQELHGYLRKASMALDRARLTYDANDHGNLIEAVENLGKALTLYVGKGMPTF